MIDFNRLAGPVLLGAIRVLGCLPRKAGIWIGKMIGGLLLAFDKKHRDIATDNVSRAFGWPPGSKRVRQIVRQAFYNLGAILFEIAWANRLDPQRYPQYFRITGTEHYDRAMAKGRGVLLLTAHMGNWELFTIMAHMAGIPANVVYRPLDSQALDEAVKQIRCRFGAQLIPTKYAFYKIAKTLKKKACVAMLMDQNVDYYNGVFVDFFGRRACTNRGMAYMALRTETPVVPVFMLRETGGFRAVVRPEIPLTRTGDLQKDIELNTVKYNAAIEAVIRQYPDQWFWVHQRWKTKAYSAWPREP
ncbi:MAG: lysophospholipid acyltransferase family protein [Desulfobacterales bacterium]|nr:lysophospholipid acyltransferase family protein [Desulfobacterales bacterium]